MMSSYVDVHLDFDTALHTATTPPGFVWCSAPPLFHAPVHVLRCAGVTVQNDGDADVIYYLNRTRLPVFSNES